MRRYVVDGAARSTEETRERERLADPQRANMIRKAAEVHRRVRKYARAELLKPGMPLIEICEKLENATRVYLEANKSPTAGTRAGVGVCVCRCLCVSVCVCRCMGAAALAEDLPEQCVCCLHTYVCARMRLRARGRWESAEWAGWCTCVSAQGKAAL